MRDRSNAGRSICRRGAWLASLVVMCLIGWNARGCVAGATGVVVLLNTDAPDRVTVLRAVIGRGATLGSNPNTRAWTPGPTTSDLHFPASFGVVPARGDRNDSAVSLQLEAQFSALRAGDPPITVRRLVRFNFVPNVTTYLHVFLNTSCASLVAAPSMCGGTATSFCTVQRYCEELVPAQTCGDEARCVPVDVRPIPMSPDGGANDGAQPADSVTTGDAAGDAAPADVSIDAVATDAAGDGPTTDTAMSTDAGDACSPRCAGRVCGSDGCGGSCGSCTSGLTCDTSGQCVCSPNCAGRACGSNGCGGSCGTCMGGLVCNGAGACVSSCTPNCAGRVCGNDGCTGSCGACMSGQACNTAGQCVCAPNCVGRACGGDGCGGSCGACPAGQSCNASGQCVCSPNCAGRSCGSDGCGGTCGACPTGTTCNAVGACVCVPNCPLGSCGSDGCGGTCVCQAFEVCRSGRCCPMGTRSCLSGQRCCGLVVPGCGCDDACICSTCACP